MASNEDIQKQLAREAEAYEAQRRAREGAEELRRKAAEEKAAGNG